jgi:hypothetical protein
MRHAFPIVLIGSCLLLTGITAQAQVYGRGSYENGRLTAEFGRYPENRDLGPALLDRVRRDVDRADSDSFRVGGGSGDHKRFNKVREELGEFQGKLSSGRFDRHELDDAIKNLQRVVNDNRLDYRDRDVLVGDLAQLREFRARY